MLTPDCTGPSTRAKQLNRTNSIHSHTQHFTPNSWESDQHNSPIPSREVGPEVSSTRSRDTSCLRASNNKTCSSSNQAERKASNESNVDLFIYLLVLFMLFASVSIRDLATSRLAKQSAWSQRPTLLLCRRDELQGYYKFLPAQPSLLPVRDVPNSLQDLAHKTSKSLSA